MLTLEKLILEVLGQEANAQSFCCEANPILKVNRLKKKKKSKITKYEIRIFEREKKNSKASNLSLLI